MSIDRAEADAQIQRRYVGPLPSLTFLRACLWAARRPVVLKAAIKLAWQGRRMPLVVARRLVRICHRARWSLSTSVSAVLDEWIVHEILLCATECPKIQIQTLLQLLHALPKPSVLIHCSAPAHIAAARVAQRGSGSLLDRVPLDVLGPLLAVAAQIDRELVKRLRELGWTVVSVDTSNDAVRAGDLAETLARNAANA